MALVQVATSEADFRIWAERLGWTKRSDGSWHHPKTGARAVHHEGALIVRVDDEKPALAQNMGALLEKNFGSKASTPTNLPPDVLDRLGEPPAPPPPAPPADSEGGTFAVTEPEPDSEGGSYAVTEPEPDAEGGSYAVTESEPDAAAAAAGADARIALQAAGVGGEIGGAVASAAEKAREALDAVKVKRRENASDEPPATSEEEQETIRRLREMGVDVGENPAPTSGYVVNVSIVAKTRLSRVIDRTEYTRKYFKRLGEREGIIDSARRRARRNIESEGGSPFMGANLVPVNRLPKLLKKLHGLRDEFYDEIEKEIGQNRDKINEEIAEAVRNHAKHEPTPDDLIPKDVRGMFEYRISIARMTIPRAQDLEDVDVDLNTAREAIDNVLRTAREVTEKAILRRFGDAYRSLGRAWDYVMRGKPLQKTAREYLRSVVKEIEDADMTKNLVIRAELEKLRAYAEFVLDAANAGDVKKSKDAIAKAVGRVVAVHNATAPMTGADEVQPPMVGSVQDGIKAITQQITRDIQAKEDRYELSNEPQKGEIDIRKVRHDGSAESARKAWLAYAQQFERLVVKG